MGDTAIFFFLTAAATCVGLIVILGNRSDTRAQTLARAFYLVSIFLGVAALAWIVAGIVHAPENAFYGRVLHLLLYRCWIVIGVGLAAAIVVCLRSCPGSRLVSDAARTFVASGYVVRGLCFSVALSLFCVEIGKLAHDAEMRQFFLQSGYTVWFMYCIMMAETLGAIGLFLRKTMLPAAFGLIVLMTGAIATHARNRDPFSDSLEAVHLLILLGCIVVLGVVRGGGWNTHRSSSWSGPTLSPKAGE